MLREGELGRERRRKAKQCGVWDAAWNKAKLGRTSEGGTVQPTNSLTPGRSRHKGKGEKVAIETLRRGFLPKATVLILFTDVLGGRQGDQFLWAIKRSVLLCSTPLPLAECTRVSNHCPLAHPLD